MIEPAPRHGRRHESRPLPTTEAGDRRAETSAFLERVPIWAREPTVERALDSAGKPLDAGVRREMEARLATDLGAVRVHTGTEAGESARSLNARAYTLGADIVFGAGQYAPSTPVGRHVLAHELAHVVQQGPDPATPRPGPGPAAAEREAHDVARSASGAGAVAHPPVRRNPATAGHVQHFDSFEHIQLGDTAIGGPTGYILLECHARDLPAHATPTVGWPPEWILRYEKGTPEQRRAITQGLTYGEIIALAGDMYADIDPRTMATSVVRTMQRINRASLLEIYELVKLLRLRPDDPEHPDLAGTAQLERATGGRYMALAPKNLSHFSNVSGGRNNLDTWRDGHTAAVALAAAGNANGAWAMSAASDHFLTDAFSAGHMRPDRADDMQSKHGQISSKIHHDLDNENGLAVHNARGDRWTAYGDDHLNDAPEDLRIARKAFVASAPDIGGAFAGLGRPGQMGAAPMVPPAAFTQADGLRIAREAVEASKADIQAALNAAAGGPGAAVPKPPFAAERFVPIVDAGTADRWGRMDWTDEVGHLAGTELPGQVWPDGDERAREWVARQPDAALRDMPLDEKKRMADRMLDGWVSDDDLDGIARLYRTSTFFQQVALRTVFASNANAGADVLQRLNRRLDRP